MSSNHNNCRLLSFLDKKSNEIKGIILIDKVNVKKYEFGVALTEDARKEYAEFKFIIQYGYRAGSYLVRQN